MPAKQTSPFIALLHGLIEYLGFFPVFLLIGVLFFSEPVVYLWLTFPLGLFILFYFLNHLLSNRWYSVALGAVLSVILSFWTAPGIWGAGMSSVICFIAALRGVQHGENDWEQIMPARIFWAICLPVYFVGYLIFTFTDSLVAYQYLLSYTGFLFLIMMLFVTNRQHLQNETLSKGKKKLNKGMLRLNRLYLILTILIVILITNFQIVQSAVLNGIRSIVAAAIWLSTLFQGEEVVEESPPQQGMPPMLGDGGQESSGWSEWMETLFLIIGITLGVILLLLFATLLFKKFRRLVKKVLVFIWEKIKQVMGRTPSDEEQTDFSDEKENLFDWKKWRKENQEKVAEAFRKMTKRKPKFEQLKTEEKVRYLYRYLAEDVKKQDRWQASLTAHEVIALTRKELQLQRLKRWYDDIRYGKQTLPEEMDAEINQLWQEFQEEK